MKRAIPIRCALLLLAAFALRGEIIDRIAISVGNRVITESDVDREIRVVAFENGRKPDFSPATRKETARRMIEQKLIRRELETNRYPEPSRSDVALKVEAFKRANYKDDAEYRQALAGYEISEQDLEDQILWQNTLLMFIEVRFRPGVQVSDEEIRDYFEKTVKPAADAAHSGEPVSLEDYRDKIEQTIAEPRLLREVDRWLAEVRRRTEIIYQDETLL